MVAAIPVQMALRDAFLAAGLGCLLCLIYSGLRFVLGQSAVALAFSDVFCCISGVLMLRSAAAVSYTHLVKAGLSLLQNTDRPGLAALISQCGLEGKELTAENVSFGLAPRLNAAGRMDSATVALRLLLSDDEEEATLLAQELDDKNAARQKAEQEISQIVLEQLTADPTYQSDRILVAWGDGFHPGVIGIVASRIAERMGKPAIIISVDENGEGKGSGRSQEGISLYEAIASCEQLLIRFGGHASAAGLSIRRENLPAFRKAINLWAAAHHPVVRCV